MTRVTPTPTRRRAVLLLVGLAVLLLAGHVVPPALINLMKLQDTGVTATYRSEATPARMLDLVALRDSEPVAGQAGREECAAGDSAPLSCFQVAGPARVERTTRTEKTAAYLEAEVSAQLTLTVSGEPRLLIDDVRRISRDSNFPVPEPSGVTRITLPDLPEFSSPAAEAPAVREGLQWFFPFKTERRSYLYFDVLAQESTPIDYVGEIEVAGLDAWEFSQTVAPRPLPEPDLAELFTGPAARFYPAAELADRGLAADTPVDLIPHYTAERTVFLEPETGVVLDWEETWHIYLAAEGEAAAPAEGEFSPRTLLHVATGWDADTREQQEHQARPDLGILRGLQILSWVADAAALVLIILLVRGVITRRAARSRALSAPVEH